MTNITDITKHKQNNNKPPVELGEDICYIKIEKDSNGKLFNEELLKSAAHRFDYVIRVVDQEDGHPVIYNYKVPYSKLAGFLQNIQSDRIAGYILEIEQYNKNDLA